jgi:hypothetical protein
VHETVLPRRSRLQHHLPMAGMLWIIVGVLFLLCALPILLV